MEREDGVSMHIDDLVRYCTSNAPQMDLFDDVDEKGNLLPRDPRADGLLAQADAILARFCDT